MITLNTDTGLVKVESWEDVQELPNFQPNLNPTEHKLDSIIGRYIFKEKINCGLSNCHTPHNKGYIVKTKKGARTNIGKDCGKNYFGVDFETLSNQFDRLSTEIENRELLWNFNFRIEDYDDKLHRLRQTEGGDKIYKKSRLLIFVNGDCPNQIVREISSIVQSRSGVLKKSREATPAEIEAIREAQNKTISLPYYIEEDISVIHGISFLYPENDLKKILINGIQEGLSSFKKLDIDSLNYNDLKFWSKWLSSLDNDFEKAEAIMEDGKALLTYENLHPLINILSQDSEKSQFQKFLKSILQPN